MTRANRRLFISYARSDGRELALRLHTDLKNEGYEVWLDTSEIDGGEVWSVKIEDEIDNCDTQLALLSKGSFESDICRAEQLRALRKTKGVIPLLVQNNADRPIHLETRHYRDFSDSNRYNEMLETLKADLRGEPIVLPIPQTTPTNAADPLPQDYVERPALMKQLCAAVLNGSIKRRIALTAVQGMGGIGKSVMASALCHEEVIRDAYPDGVVWLKIGQSPGNLLEHMRIVARTLGDDLSVYTSELEAQSALRLLLPSKAALIVLDDVWDLKHVMPFVIEAPRSRVLFTTRDKGMARHRQVNATLVEVGGMEPDEALRLLGGNDKERAQIAEKVGYHALALSLAAGKLRCGMTPSDWLTQYDIVRLKLLKERRNAHDRDDNIEACFNLSVKGLKANDVLLYHHSASSQKAYGFNGR